MLLLMKIIKHLFDCTFFKVIVSTPLLGAWFRMRLQDLKVVRNKSLPDLEGTQSRKFVGSSPYCFSPRSCEGLFANSWICWTTSWFWKSWWSSESHWVGEFDQLGFRLSNTLSIGLFYLLNTLFSLLSGTLCNSIDKYIRFCIPLLIVLSFGSWLSYSNLIWYYFVSGAVYP